MLRARHKSTKDNEGSFSFVPTPIGNLSDITLHAIDVLKECDVILCEDTRVTGKLLAHYGISKPLYTLHDHNEKHKTEQLIKQALEGTSFAVVSDAGTPVVSDPGYHLLNTAISEGVKVKALPGANAAITALVLSGFSPFPSTLLGFCPRTKGERKKLFTQLKEAESHSLKPTFIFYESPRRLVSTLEDLVTVLGPDRLAVVARELTKTFEEVVRSPLKDLVTHFKENEPKGEITLLIGPGEDEPIQEEDLDKAILKALEEHSVKEASALVSKVLGVSKRDVYKRALLLKN